MPLRDQTLAMLAASALRLICSRLCIDKLGFLCGVVDEAFSLSPACVSAYNTVCAVRRGAAFKFEELKHRCPVTAKVAGQLL